MNEAAAATKKSGLIDKAADTTKRDRARRFEIEVPILFRGKGETQWRNGKSKNISRTGVMFVAEEPVAVGTEIEIQIVLNATVQLAADDEASVADDEAKGIPVTCKGEVVRNVLVPWPEVFPSISARFDNYRFGE